jgi:acyl dehydratase
MTSDDDLATILITREDIRHFAVSIRAMNPIHHNVTAAKGAGHRDLVAPPFFFLVLGMSHGRTLPADQLRPDGMPLGDVVAGRVVAGGTKVKLLAPIVAGDYLSITQELISEEQKPGRSGQLTFFTYSRKYFVENLLVVDETMVRIGR